MGLVSVSDVSASVPICYATLMVVVACWYMRIDLRGLCSWTKRSTQGGIEAGRFAGY